LLAIHAVYSRDEWIERYIAGTLPQEALDEVLNVMPLRNQDLADLLGRTCVAVVYDSDISIEFPSPVNLTVRRLSIQTDHGGAYNVLITH